MLRNLLQGNMKMTQATEGQKITVRLRKAGWEVEITCAESQLRQAIESVLSSLNSSEISAGVKREEDARALGGNKTCRGLIIELWQESWFEEPRQLSDVHEEIARRGYHYDRTAVSHALTDLVKEGILSRQGNMRNYVYIQKRPYGAQSTSPAQPTTFPTPIQNTEEKEADSE